LTLNERLRPTVRFLTDRTVDLIVRDAKRVLDEIGVFVEHDKAVELLVGAGGRLRDDRRVRIGPDLVERALSAAPSEVLVHDRGGDNPVSIGGDQVNFVPGSAAIKVFDYAESRTRPSTAADCVKFARLTQRLPAMALQSTCVVPDDVPLEEADLARLRVALMHCTKGVVTGTFTDASFETMRRMLVAVRGSEEALRAKPLAIFDCCPSPPLEWSELTCSVLVSCAEHGIPAELVSMPLTGATAPVTLIGAVTQHTAENLSGVVIHQLAAPGSPIIYGGSPSAFDMRHGTTPMGAIETMMIDAAYAQVGTRLGLPTHAYMALSDAKTPDYQAGLESGSGAVLAAMAGINVVSGPGILDFESCQSLEKLVLDHEACRMAQRAVRGIDSRDDDIVKLVREGIEAEQFLNLDHTRECFREEHSFPGPVIDRMVGDAWAMQGAKSALERAHEEVARLLAEEDAPPLDAGVVRELDGLGL
jgi:trimethylamine--corrinoid protein Co-methyltransferase